MQVIDEFEGVLPFNDKVSPEVIDREFGLSKMPSNGRWTSAQGEEDRHHRESNYESEMSNRFPDNANLSGMDNNIRTKWLHRFIRTG